MDDIDDVFESRFDPAGSWSRPPRGPDDALFAKEAGREIDDCLEASNQSAVRRWLSRFSLPSLH